MHSERCRPLESHAFARGTKGMSFGQELNNHVVYGEGQKQMRYSERQTWKIKMKLNVSKQNQKQLERHIQTLYLQIE